MNVRNNFFRIAVAPDLGCRWLSCAVRHRGRWADVLWKAPSPNAARKNPFLYGLYLLAPWCNRLPGRGMHGDAYRHPWTVLSRSASGFRARLDTRRIVDFNFSVKVVFDLSLTLRRRTAELSLNATNVDKKSTPVGLGFHPFFLKPLRFTLPARLKAVKAGPFPGKKHRYRPVDESIDPEETPLDHNFSALVKNRGVRMSFGKENVPLMLGWSGNATDVFVYAPRRHEGKKAGFVCIEPMTMRPGFFDSKLALAPGKTRRLSMKLALSSASLRGK